MLATISFCRAIFSRPLTTYPSACAKYCSIIHSPSMSQYYFRLLKVLLAGPPKLDAVNVNSSWAVSASLSIFAAVSDGYV